MPHYKNGREAREFDPVIGTDCGGNSVYGRIYNINTQSETCNAMLANTIPGGTLPVYVTLDECFHAQDAYDCIAAQQAAVDTLRTVVKERGEAPATGIATTSIAGRLYECYCEAVGGKAFNGDVLPTWAEFTADVNKEKQAKAWVAVANLAAMLFGYSKTYTDGTVVTGPGPLPEMSPAQQDAAAAPYLVMPKPVEHVVVEFAVTPNVGQDIERALKMTP